MNQSCEVVDVKALGEAIVARRDLDKRGKAVLSLRAVAEQAGVWRRGRACWKGSSKYLEDHAYEGE